MKAIRWLGCPALLCVVLAASSACNAAGMAKYQYFVRDGMLLQGERGDKVSIRAIDTPTLADPESFTLDSMARTLAHLSEVGANGVSFNLYGLSDDGAQLSGEAVTTLQTLMKELDYRHIAAVCKVFGVTTPTDPARRQAAAKTVAGALKSSNDLLFWIDGPDSADLVKDFHAAASKLITVAPAGGDMAVVTSPAQAGPLALLVGALPADPLQSEIHYLLPDAPESYDTFERIMADPVEKEPWTPDNSVLTEAERQEGWIALFDGKTLKGWTITGENKQGFVVRDGTIEWNARGGQTLRTRDRYDNFVLQLDYRIDKGKNSGIQLRTPRANRASKIGFEFQLQGDHGAAPDTHTTGSVYDVAAPLVNATKPDSEWNSVEITLDGPHLKAVLNGQIVQDLNFDDSDELRCRLRKGFILLQDHGGHVAFRNIRLKKL